MAKRIEILLAGRNKALIERLEADLIAADRFRIATRHIENGHADPLYGLSELPDVVLLILDDRGHSDLEALLGDQGDDAPPMIVAAENGDAAMMRLAMRAGARDFLSGALDLDEMIETIDRVALQFIDKSREPGHELTIFVNAKGGSGATFAACNVAHILTSRSERATALLSLDLQFGGLSQHFDTKLRHGLMEVLDSVDNLDQVALDAYMTQHESGLRLLAAEPEKTIRCHSDRAGQVATLVQKMLSCYEHVIIDMPRRIDPYFVPVLESASRVVLVLQQSLGHLRDASRMLELFENYAITPEQVIVVVNRYDKNAPISLQDIERTLKGTDISIVPSDFKTVAESINLGVPIHQHAKGSAVTKALCALEQKITGVQSDAMPGMLSRALSGILRKEQRS